MWADGTWLGMENEQDHFVYITDFDITITNMTYDVSINNNGYDVDVEVESTAVIEIDTPSYIIEIEEI